MIKKSLSVVRVAAFCLPLVLVASCGTGSEAVQNTVVNIDPPDIAQNVLAGTTSSITNSKYRIEVKSPTGYPQIGVSLVISSPGILSTVDTSASPAIFTPMAAAGNTYTVTTDSNGTYTTAVSFTSPVSADGEVTILSAWSGTGYNRVNITYTCVDNGATLCP